MDTYIYELGAREENLSKRKKIDALRLSPEEWERVRLFCDLLGVSLITVAAGCIDLTHTAC